MEKRGRWTPERIKELASRAGSQQNLATLVGTGPDHVNRWIKGRRKPNRVSEKAMDRVDADLSASA